MTPKPSTPKCWPWDHDWHWAEKIVERYSREPYAGFETGDAKDGLVHFSRIVQYGKCERCGMQKRRTL